jgi:uncharacterized protein YoxC
MDKVIDKSNALNVEALEGGAECMGRLADSFEASARRWELIVYPSMVAFILLAAYGFYLIYNLTHDIADVAKSVREMTASVTEDLGEISGKMTQIASATTYMKPMSQDMRAMSGSINEMNTNVSQMQYSVWQLNRNVSAPFNMVDKMMPFGSSRPYGKASSRISPPRYPTYPRQPAVFTPQTAIPGATSLMPTTATGAKPVAYTYYPYGNYRQIRRF